MFHNKSRHHSERPGHHSEEEPLLTWRKPMQSKEDPAQSKLKKFFFKRWTNEGRCFHVEEMEIPRSACRLQMGPFCLAGSCLMNLLRQQAVRKS